MECYYFFQEARIWANKSMVLANIHSFIDVSCVVHVLVATFELLMNPSALMGLTITLPLCMEQQGILSKC